MSKGERCWLYPGAHMLRTCFAIVPHLLRRFHQGFPYMFRIYKRTGHIRDIYGISTRQIRNVVEAGANLVQPRYKHG